MEYLSELKKSMPMKDWYWDVKSFSTLNYSTIGKSSFLENSISMFLNQLNYDECTSVEKIEVIKNEKETSVFVFFKYKLSWEEKIVKRFEKIKELNHSETISENLRLLMIVLKEDSNEFAFETEIDINELTKVEDDEMEITDEMLRAIKKRFPSISIKIFTNGEREDF